MSRKALLFIESGVAKIVYGNSLKCVKLEEIDLPYNVEFFEKLFSHCQVLIVEGVQILSYESLRAAVSKEAAAAPPPQAQAPVAQQEYQPPQCTPHFPPQDSAMAAPPRPQLAPQRPLPPQPTGPQKSPWIKCNAKTTITIDDLYTNVEIAPGMHQAVSIQPNRAFNLQNISPNNVRQSAILRRLLQNGILSPCTAEEAARLEETYLRRQSEQSMMDNRIRDRQIDSASPIIGDGSRGSAEMYAMGMYDRGGHDGDFISTVDGRQHRVESIDMTRDIASIDISSGGVRPMRGSHENYSSMESLMEVLNAAPPPHVADMMAPKRQLAARQKTEVIPYMRAAPIKSDHQFY